MHHEAWRVQQGEQCFCTGLPGLDALHSSASSEGCSTLESAGVSTEPWAAAGQADPLGTTGKWGNARHPALLLPRVAQGSVQGALLKPLPTNRLLPISSRHSCSRIWLEGR